MFNLLIPTAYAASQAAGKEDSGLDYAGIAGKALLVVVIVFLAFIVAAILRNWVQKLIEKKQGEAHQEVKILYGRIVFVAVLAAGAVLALLAVGAPLQLFSGALGVGFALAMQGPVANFVAGLILLNNETFNLGDFVIVDGVDSGTIVDIQSRATTLRATDGGQVTIPNVTMLASKITCYTKNPIRRHTITLGVGYGSDLEKVCEIIRDVITKHPSVEPTPAPNALVKSVDESAITINANFWTESHSKWWEVKSHLTRDIFNALTAAGVDIPYPVRTLRVDNASSDILAGEKNLLPNLAKLEVAKKAEFTAVPTEIAPAAAPTPTVFAPPAAPVAEAAPAVAAVVATELTV